jgi:hypothetical protein
VVEVLAFLSRRRIPLILQARTLGREPADMLTATAFLRASSWQC